METADAVLHHLLDPVDHRQYGRQGERGTEQIEASLVGILGLADQQGSGDQQQHHDRNIDQEDRAPVEVFEQQPADDGTDGEAAGEGRSPDADGGAALILIQEHSADQRQRGRCQCGSPDTEHGPGCDEHLRAGRVGGHHGGQAEGDGADQQHPAPPNAVADAAHGDEQHRP